MAELDAACYVIDCLPNMNATTVTERCVPLVKQLRKARPNTPILLVEDRSFANAWLIPAKAKFHDENRAALRKAYEQLKAAGMKQLHYLSGDLLLGDDAEGTTDGSHPNDLGFLRQADAIEPVLRRALGLK
jgi:lysophospholipase L1-like esterase